MAVGIPNKTSVAKMPSGGGRRSRFIATGASNTTVPSGPRQSRVGDMGSPMQSNVAVPTGTSALQAKRNGPRGTVYSGQNLSV